MVNSNIVQKIINLSLNCSGYEFINGVIETVSNGTNGSFCFLGILKDAEADIVMGCMAHQGAITRESFEYCMTDQPCRLIYDDQILSIPCDVHKDFLRKNGSGLESFIGFPIKHPKKGILAHFASYHQDQNQYDDLSPDCVEMIQSLLAREVNTMLDEFKLDQIKQNADEWRQAALVDPLTKAMNRRALSSDWEQMLQGEDCSGSLAVIDIDFFKKINDSLGHDVGDLCLQIMPDVFGALTKDGAFTFYRLGGEEFCVLAPNMNQGELRYCLKETQSALAAKLKDHKTLPVFTFSAGVSSFDRASLSDTLREADEKLYEAKRNGRNLVV